MGWQDAPVIGAPSAAPSEPNQSLPAMPVSGWASAPAVEAPTPVYSGSVLPFTRYSDGSTGFDSNAGLLGQIKNNFNMFGDVASGKLDPNSPGALVRSLNAAAMFSPSTPAVNAGEVVVPGVFGSPDAPAPPIPTADALHAAGSAGFDAARNMGVEYAPPAVANLASGVQQGLNNDGILANLAPKTHAVLDSLQNVPSDAVSVPFGSLDAARKAFGNLTQEFTNPTEQAAAARAKSAIQGFVSEPPQSSVLSGPSDAAASALKDAIANSAAGFRSDRINDIQRTADLRSAAANSGANIGNTTRQRVASLLLSDKKSSGFNPDEISALEGVVQGSPASNAARWAANMAGGGGGIGHTMATVLGGGLGAALGGEVGAGIGAGAATAVGPALKAVQNSMDTKALTAADELVRSRSPLAQALADQQTPFIPTSSPASIALSRALALSKAQQGAPQQQIPATPPPTPYGWVM